MLRWRCGLTRKDKIRNEWVGHVQRRPTDAPVRRWDYGTEIILSQEKNIQKLNELVRSLREQLLQCRGENEIVNSTSAPLTELLSELERHPLLED
ncbi:hypothetical protein DVH24_019248 [Malus domestica]|uniref:Uncharacterized protein n=1 Tax=Malus domestica TaxID=3750 RepID=A0A498HZV6_MALDO|nr:hypothetical protein DVH24_019248 [Malus domestica]